MGREVPQDPQLCATWVQVTVADQAELKRCREWCRESAVGRWANIDIWFWNFYRKREATIPNDAERENFHSPHFWFKDANDAMMFKLRWG
jgi:hypothetical protein